MFDTPDLSTLRLCSLLASAAFALVFLLLCYARRGGPHLLIWSASSVGYCLALFVLDRVEGSMGAGLGALVYTGMAAVNMLILAGLHAFEGRRAFRPTMLLVAAAAGLGYAAPLAAGLNVGMARIGGTLGLAVSMLAAGLPMLRASRRQAPRSARIAGIALLGYMPGYAVAVLLELSRAPSVNMFALLPMLSDQLLLAVLNLGLIAMSGERAENALRRAARHDPLTGAWNRAGLAAHEAALAMPGTAVVLIDVDHFKRVNDRHGHGAGDAVLSALAGRVLALTAGDGGRLVRLGGDEFALILPRAGHGGALAIAETVRCRWAASQDGLPRVTISLGAAVVEPGEASLAPALARADRSLYAAKAEGRDRVAA